MSIKSSALDINLLRKEIEDRGIEFEDDVIYILPDGKCENGNDLLNEYAPDISKLLRERGCQTSIVRSEEYSYLGLRSSDIILPLVYGVPFSIWANFITDWIKDSFSSHDVMTVKFVKDDKDEYREYEIKGKCSEIESILDKLKEH